MIPAGELRRGPVYVEPLNPPSVEQAFRTAIEKTALQVVKPIRVAEDRDLNGSELLYARTIGDEVEFRGVFGNNSGRETLDGVQEIMFQVMREYGFKPDVFNPDTAVAPYGIIRYPNGTARQWLLYPTSTPGLYIRRKRDFYMDSNETYAVGWDTLDRAPNRLDLKRWWQGVKATPIFSGGGTPSTPR